MRPRIELFFLIAGVSCLHAQGRDVDFLYGRWQGNQSTSYELRTATPLGGAFSHGLAGYVLLHDSLGRNRAFYGAGWELQAFRHRRTFGPYALAGVALGLSTDTSSQELAALWNLGAGLEWRPISRVGVGMESALSPAGRRTAGIRRLPRTRVMASMRADVPLASARRGVPAEVGRGGEREGKRGASGRDLRRWWYQPQSPAMRRTSRSALDVIGRRTCGVERRRTGSIAPGSCSGRTAARHACPG